jgi:hypothetical protein
MTAEKKRMSTSNSALPQQIYIIRHGEKPADPPAPQHSKPTPPSAPPFGVDFDGNQDVDSLLPRGWQRSGALTVLFDPTLGARQAGLRSPSALYSPAYGHADKTQLHRTYQTIQGLSARLGLAIQSPAPVGQESALAQAVLASGSPVVLICWEHHHIPLIAQAIPTVAGTAIPAAWSGDRFDVIWAFVLDTASGSYVFSQVPQQLLDGDTDTVISRAEEI